eukprot:CAMPEP_0204575766 /NCGR_PEP_ID=MMETSP0661-20131031/41387_1 /ASSEMBLY_ACC=CAM_ASM_000606 /TAXON_ID=109239 /ORGANISM="Alexandrium margalefi, Strain AMGDE01CS-322" /LENGTH=133 /DNA_ID=CAMNT_0051584439 /DNA_START=82 /DNA_END=483 /DNA_ORIENTATION=-
MGAKCCAGQEASGQPDAAPLASSQSPMAEETVKVKEKRAVDTSPGEAEFTIKIAKTAVESRLGIDVDLSENVWLHVEAVNPGLVMEWNKANPRKAVKAGDKIVAVNSVRGDAYAMTEECKASSELNMAIQPGF